jgi:hypothetical protein
MNYRPAEKIENFLESIPLNFSWISEEIREKISYGKPDEIEFKEERKRTRGLSSIEYSEEEQEKVCTNTIKTYFIDLFEIENSLSETSFQGINGQKQKFEYLVFNNKDFAEPKLFDIKFISYFNELKRLVR